MFKTPAFVTLLGLLLIGLTGCGGTEPAEVAEAPATPEPEPEEQIPVYELTDVAVTDKTDWTSRNISVLGVKLGDRTRNVEKDLGELVNTRTGPEDYITAYQNGGLVIYTQKLTGRARKIEINNFLGDQIQDEKIRQLLVQGDVDYMRELFGREGDIVQNEGPVSTEYVYGRRGFRFIKYTVQGRKINALRFEEVRRTPTS